MTLRDAFESWISLPPFEHMCDRNSNKSAWPGAYKRYETELAWEAYQAAHAKQQKRIDELRDATDEIWACANSGYSLDDLKSKIAMSAEAVAHMDKEDGTLQWLPHNQTVEPGAYLYLRNSSAMAQEGE